MNIVLVLTVGVLCIACFLIGAKVGQTVSSGEEIKLPNINPVQAYKEHAAKKEAEAEQSRIDTIMKNIESYDGTSNGQNDVPRR